MRLKLLREPINARESEGSYRQGILTDDDQLPSQKLFQFSQRMYKNITL